MDLVQVADHLRLLRPQVGQILEMCAVTFSHHMIISMITWRHRNCPATLAHLNFYTCIYILYYILLYTVYTLTYIDMGPWIYDCIYDILIYTCYVMLCVLMFEGRDQFCQKVLSAPDTLQAFY